MADETFEQQVAEAIHRFRTPQGAIVLPMHIAELLAPRVAAAIDVAAWAAAGKQLGRDVGQDISRERSPMELALEALRGLDA